MIVVHRGLGMLVLLYGILAALLTNILTSKIFGGKSVQSRQLIITARFRFHNIMVGFGKDLDRIVRIS
jgi:hypothetical protein